MTKPNPRSREGRLLWHIVSHMQDEDSHVSFYDIFGEVSRDLVEWRDEALKSAGLPAWHEFSRQFHPAWGKYPYGDMIASSRGSQDDQQ